MKKRYAMVRRYARNNHADHFSFCSLLSLNPQRTPWLTLTSQTALLWCRMKSPT